MQSYYLQVKINKTAANTVSYAIGVLVINQAFLLTLRSVTVDRKVAPKSPTAYPPNVMRYFTEHY